MSVVQKHPKLGLGCVTFGREIDQSKSFDLLDYAYRYGIRFFDTAAVYSNGKSEEILGIWLRLRGIDRRGVKIDTKITPPFNEERIPNAVNESLSRLNVDYIDTLYLHRWDETLNIRSWLALTEVVKAGLVKKIGISNISSSNLKKVLEMGTEVAHSESISVIQNNNNLAVSDLNAEIIALCSTYKIEIVTFSPLGAGFLTGKHQQGIVKNSRFDLMPAHQDIYCNQVAQTRLLRLLKVSKEYGRSAEFLALAWAIYQQQTSTVLIGGRTAAHLDVAFEAEKFYDKELFEELNSIAMQS